jgi:transcriptional regulator with XRE-family HTH domain
MAATTTSRGELVRLERHTYEEPFLDMASTRLPKSVRKLQELCQIFGITHPQISPIVWRLAEYPITNLIYTGDEEAQRQHKELFEDELEILDRMIEWGLDYHAYGNCFITISFPFMRFYKCLGCKKEVAAKDIKYRYDGRKFTGNCKECKILSQFEPVDQYLKGTTKGIRVFRLEPQLITPKYNRVTGKTVYYYMIPSDLKMAIKAGDRDTIDDTPVAYLKATRFNRPIKLKRVFHFKRPTLSGRNMQWGLPSIMPALKDAYLNQIYKKADEQIALEHSVPLRILYPEPGSQDPLNKLLLGSFRGFMERNVRYWRRDKNAILTSPLPVGVRVIGGDGANYSTIAARTKVIDEIMMAMGTTPGFVRGGENWSSMSISQRVMENSFGNYLRRIDKALQWTRDEVAKFINLPDCGVSMKPFKKIDDVQTLQLLMNLAQQDKVSWNEVLSRFDLDEVEQLKKTADTLPKHVNIMVEKLIGQAEASAKSATLNATAEIDAQSAQGLLQEMIQGAEKPPEPKQIPQDTGGERRKPESGDGGGDDNSKVEELLDRYAAELLTMGDDEKRSVLKQMTKQNPEFARAVVERAVHFERQDIDTILKESKAPAEIAQRILMLPPNRQALAIRRLQSTNPPLYMHVINDLARLNREQAGTVPGKNQVDMRPQPEKLPPRRKDKVS